jgi:UDP-GlcNAc:undecaprenyl-phosphate GlcNAc-1-phosphate transferase
LACSIFVCLVGLVDDIFNIGPRAKLAAQIAAAATACSLGVRIEVLSAEGLFSWQLGWLAWPITIAWMVALTNAVNLIDGLDGLAAGISAIACAVMAILAILAGQTILSAFLLALLGSLMGFLFFNFNPARIFLGDCGSTFLGFFLSGSAVLCASSTSSLTGLGIVLLAMGIPATDTLFSIVRRVLNRRSLFAPDRGHIHHQLIEMGLSQRRAVLAMYLVTLLASLTGLCMLFVSGPGLAGVFLLGLVPLGVVFRLAGAMRLREAAQAFRANRAIIRDARRQQQSFEKMQLRFREARTLDQWWRVVRRTAREMGFARLTIDLETQDDPGWHLNWISPRHGATDGEVIHVDFWLSRRLGGLPIRVEAEVLVDGSLESVGRRLALFGRLLDEHANGNLLALLDESPDYVSSGSSDPNSHEDLKIAKTLGETVSDRL